MNAKKLKPKEPINRCPRCLVLSIKEGNPADSNPATADQEDQLVDLVVTALFGCEEKEKFKGGQVKWGLSKGELILELNSCNMPTDLRLHLCSELPTNEAVTIKSQEKSFKGKLSITSIEGEIGAGGNASEHKDFKAKIKCFGEDNKPIWCFEALSPQRLEGQKNGCLGTAIFEEGAQECRIVATFKTEPRNIKIIEGSGVFSRPVSPEKAGILDRMLAKRIFQTRVKDGLYQQELIYG